MTHLERLRRGGQLALGRNLSAVTPDAVAFLDPIDQICEARPLPLLRATHLLALAMFLSLLAVACVVRVDIVVVGSGRIETETAPVVVQPMERAIIRTLAVRPGDTVRRGQVLATLDPTFAGADLAAARAQAHAAQAEIRRLDAEARGFAFVAVDDAGDADALLQQTLSRQRLAEFQARLGAFDADIGKLRLTIAATETERSALGDQVDVARQVEAMRATLLQERNGSRLQYLGALDERLRAERAQQESADHLPELQRGLQSLLADRESYVDGWHRDVLERLVTKRIERATLDEQIAKAARLNELVELRAAQDGVVLDVARLSAGSVVREAEPLATLIPADAVLIADVSIRSADVGDLTPGCPVEIKVDAFPYQRHGILKGRLLSIGEESFSAGMASTPGAPPSAASGDGVGAYHRARVALLRSELHRLPPGARLFPGMTLNAEFKVGTRRAVAYFISPLTRGFQESLREP